MGGCATRSASTCSQLIHLVHLFHLIWMRNVIHLLHQVHLQIRSVSPDFDLIAWLYPPNATNKHFINLCYGNDQCQEDYRVESNF